MDFMYIVYDTTNLNVVDTFAFYMKAGALADSDDALRCINRTHPMNQSLLPKLVFPGRSNPFAVAAAPAPSETEEQEFTVAWKTEKIRAKSPEAAARKIMDDHFLPGDADLFEVTDSHGTTVTVHANNVHRWRNYYRCPACSTEWEDTWSCQVDDDCPDCGHRHISPYDSDDILDD